MKLAQLSLPLLNVCVGVILILVIGSFWCCQASAAGPTDLWTYDSLLEEADVVCIANLVSTEKKENKENLPDHLDQFESVLVVRANLKGRLDDKRVKFVHYKYKPNVNALGNGPTFPALEPREEDKSVKARTNASEAKKREVATPVFLFFLKRRTDGRFGPASGDDDAVYSVARVIGYAWEDAE